jgi:hypothetical protein
LQEAVQELMSLDMYLIGHKTGTAMCATGQVHQVWLSRISNWHFLESRGDSSGALGKEVLGAEWIWDSLH